MAIVTPSTTSRTTVGLDALVRVPHFALGDIKRLCFSHARHPLSGCARGEAERRRPFGPAPLQDLQPYYGRLRPCAPHRYSGPRSVCPLGLLPSHRDDRFPRSSLKPDPGSRRLYAGRRSSSRQAPLDLVSRANKPSPVSTPSEFVSTRHTTVHLRSSLWIAPDAVWPRLLPQRSPPGLFTQAA